MTKKELAKKIDKPQYSRRIFIMELSAFVSSLFLPKILKGTESIENRHPITPPGSISLDNFNRHCTSCHLCVSRCPQKILKPTKLEYGLKGIMQPQLNYNDGYCEYDCIECAKVCPTGALRVKNNENVDTLIEKQHTQIGIAKYNNNFCIVNSKKISCEKCANGCPVGAIKMIKKTDNNLLVPSIDIKKCIGCGACEYYCPTTADKKAIWIDGLKIHNKV